MFACSCLRGVLMKGLKLLLRAFFLFEKKKIKEETGIKKEKESDSKKKRK
jgi:hypothetical protein